MCFFFNTYFLIIHSFITISNLYTSETPKKRSRTLFSGTIFRARNCLLRRRNVIPSRQLKLTYKNINIICAFISPGFPRTDLPFVMMFSCVSCFLPFREVCFRIQLTVLLFNISFRHCDFDQSRSNDFRIDVDEHYDES